MILHPMARRVRSQGSVSSQKICELESMGPRDRQRHLFWNRGLERQRSRILFERIKCVSYRSKPQNV